MTKSRLEAFSDGVIAIIITIMVLELKVPHETTLAALVPLIPTFLSYLLSFVFVGIYWGNHHHLLHTLHHVNSRIIWSNMGLLFTLSLVPFTTAWMGENHFANVPVAVYGFNLLICGSAYYVLQIAIAKHYTHSTTLTDALKKQTIKGLISLVSYSLAIPCAFWFPLVSAILYAFVAIMWVIPDRNIERALKE